MRVYIAGPMRGLPHFNFPKFYEAAQAARDKGHVAINPAELDCEKWPNHDWSTDQLPVDFCYKERLLEDLVWIMGCDEIWLLPGWGFSRGAIAELAFAKACELKVRLYLGNGRVSEAGENAYAG